MTWLAAILLAVVSFAAIVLIYGLPRKSWTILLATLALGLAGYAFQASPHIPGASAKPAVPQEEEGWGLVDTRKEFVDSDGRSTNKLMITADALVRNGQYGNAAALLRGIVRENPRDGEAWLAMGNALTFHADGLLTPSALMAYRHAAQEAPQSAGPAFFMGVALIRQGRLIEAHQTWSERLRTMPEGAVGREQLASRLGELENLMRQIAEQATREEP